MKKTKSYEEGGKTILDRSKGKLVSKSEYAASRAKPAAKAPSSVLDRDRTGMTPAAPKPAPKVAKPEAPARKSPITANFTKTGEQFKPNPLKRTGLTPKQKAGIDKAAGDLRKSFIKEGVDKAAGDLMKSAKGQDFRSSFAAARKAGKKEFTWNGKKYNTKLKGE
jgi:hypothetical protein